MRIKVSGDPKTLKKRMLERFQAAKKVHGRALAKGLLEEVIKRVPEGEAWLKLYRDALRYLESTDGERWAVAGVSPTKLTTVPADATQIKFLDGGGKIIDVLRPFVWTVDTLPAIAGGYKADVVIRHASPSEMDGHRKKLRPMLPELVESLEAAGANVIDGFPRVNGTVLMDLKFLQLRLEHGLGGFPRVPHMKPAARAAKNKAHAWVSARKATIQKVLDGGGGTEAEVIDDNLKKLLENWRAKDFAR